MNTIAWVAVVVIVAVIGAVQQRPLGAEIEPGFSEVEAAVLVADLVGVMERDWPPAHTRLAITEGTDLPVALEARLRGAGYAVDAGSSGDQVQVALFADRIGGLEEYRLGLAVGAEWQLDRQYRRDDSGRLRAAGGYSLRGGRGVRGPLERPEYEIRAARRSAEAVEILHVWQVELDHAETVEELQGRLDELETLGLPALVVNNGNGHALRAGPFRDLGRAREVATLLQVSGYVGAAILDVTESRMARGEAAAAPAPEAGQDGPCQAITIEAGSLRSNAGRLLEKCGYRLGAWKLGDESELEDLIIPVAYEVEVQGEVWGLLAFLEEAYGIRATVRELDGAVDFEAAEEGI